MSNANISPGLEGETYKIRYRQENPRVTTSFTHAFLDTFSEILHHEVGMGKIFTEGVHHLNFNPYK